MGPRRSRITRAHPRPAFPPVCCRWAAPSHYGCLRPPRPLAGRGRRAVAQPGGGHKRPPPRRPLAGRGRPRRPGRGPTATPSSRPFGRRLTARSAHNVLLAPTAPNSNGEPGRSRWSSSRLGSDGACAAGRAGGGGVVSGHGGPSCGHCSHCGGCCGNRVAKISMPCRGTHLREGARGSRGGEPLRVRQVLGFHEGVNWGSPFPCSFPNALAFKWASAALQSNFELAEFTSDFTAARRSRRPGRFRRVDWTTRRRGVDHMHDE